MKLKKQLVEKEKALAEEQEASQVFQNKLKELRSEYNTERSRLTQACRQFEESIMAKQNEVQNLQCRLQHVMDTHVSEKQVLTQKIQQVGGPLLIFTSSKLFKKCLYTVLDQWTV